MSLSVEQVAKLLVKESLPLYLEEGYELTQTEDEVIAEYVEDYHSNEDPMAKFMFNIVNAAYKMGQESVSKT